MGWYWFYGRFRQFCSPNRTGILWPLGRNRWGSAFRPLLRVLKKKWNVPLWFLSCFWERETVKQEVRWEVLNTHTHTYTGNAVWTVGDDSWNGPLHRFYMLVQYVKASKSPLMPLLQNGVCEFGHLNERFLPKTCQMCNSLQCLLMMISWGIEGSSVIRQILSQLTRTDV